MASSVPARASQSDSVPRWPGSKRRRVAKACVSCRLRKSKCDGRHPVCSRCRDYEHMCTWSESKRDYSRLGTSIQEHESVSRTPERPQSAPSPDDYSLLRQAIQSYDDLFDTIEYNLSDSDRAVVESTLSSIRQLLPPKIGPILPAGTSNTSISLEEITPISSGRRSAATQRYLGEASELRFYHSVKRVLRDDQISETTLGNNIDGYDQEENYMAGPKGGRIAPNPPPRPLADTYVGIYFSTIHIAYPFVCRPVFMANYEQYWRGDIESGKHLSWVPLLYTVFALGAYYTSFPRSEGEGFQKHSQYFEYASSLAAPVMTDCTLENIQILISQCLFLLATSQTDRCWTLLGLAIRIAQTIGLHVEDSQNRSLSNPSLLEEETMRRTWYTMYNLDRLLALQLGRPIAIHDDDYYVTLPSKAEDIYLRTDMEEHSPPLDGGPSSVDFFICVIRFSGVLGQVISNLYRPSQLKPDPDLMFTNIATLDDSLLKWKNSLPRHLRFDLGHVFENSITFMRQRNMLAIKFHHLRALIHRPYLCISRLQRNNGPLMDLLHRFPDRVNYMERTCVFEAQQTAHLLNNVADTGSLVHDFPWWQMIPCLLCASSILLVASAHTEPGQISTEHNIVELKEDAETCLKVFDALSVNSNAARRARDMLESLKTSNILSRDLLSTPNNSLPTRESQSGCASTTHLTGYSLGSTLDEQVVWDMRSGPLECGSWPLELSDTMTWSAQFLDPRFSFKPQATPMMALGDIDGQTGMEIQSGEIL